MIKLSANLSFLFNEVSFKKKFKEASKVGFKAVEFLFPYEYNVNEITFNYTGFTAATNTVQIKELEFYKSVSWHVHSLKDMTDGYIIFNCVRTRGRDDARRRAYD